MKGPEKILILLAICLCASCGVQRHVPTEVVNVRDSVVVHVKDSVAIRFDIISVELPSETFSVILAPPDSSHLETSLATSDAWVDTLGLLHHCLSNKDTTLNKEVPLQEHYHSDITEQQHQEHETITEYVEIEKKLSWWQKLWITSGKVLWGIVAALLLYGVIKLLIKLK